MATLNRVTNGLLLKDAMSSIRPYWDVQPKDNNRVDINTGKVILKHGDGRVSMLMNAPVEDYVFQAQMFHEPIGLGDIGGVTVMADNNNSVECQSYYNGLAGAAQHYKAIKTIKTGDRYLFYGTKNNIAWEVIGSSLLLDAHLIGFFLDGPDLPNFKQYRIDSVSFYKSNYLTFIGVPNSYVLKIYDSNMTEVISINALLGNQGGNKIVHSALDKILPIEGATIRLFDAGILVYETKGFDVCGGDIYDFTYQLEILFNDLLMHTESEYDLGYVGTGGIENKITIINKDSTVFKDKRIKVEQYSDYYRGGNFTELAVIDELGMVGEFSKEITVPDLIPDQRVEIMMRTVRDASSEAPFFVREYKYRVVIE